jgi:hypothetical protein
MNFMAGEFGTAPGRLHRGARRLTVPRARLPEQPLVERERLGRSDHESDEVAVPRVEHESCAPKARSRQLAVAGLAYKLPS